MAFEAVYRALPDGRTATIGVTDGATDPCSTGEALEAAARLTGDPRLRQGADALRRWAMKDAPRSRDGIVYHLTGGQALWVDSFYMLPPYLAAIGEYDEAMRQFDGYWKALYDPKSGLLFHIWDDAESALGRPVHWGTGNGWALAAMARMIPMLRDGQAKRILIARAKGLLDAVLEWMDPDGSFHDILDDPASFREVNMSQMAAYTIYRGASQGWLYCNNSTKGTINDEQILEAGGKAVVFPSAAAPGNAGTVDYRQGAGAGRSVQLRQYVRSQLR